jgi:hypothetical protein
LKLDLHLSYHFRFQTREANELPSYLCRKCGDLLTQFKAFKETCIESDAYLRKAVSNTTLPLLPLELIKVESQTYDAEDSLLIAMTLPSKRKRKPTKKQEEFENQRKSARAKRNISREQVKVVSPTENVELLESNDKTEIEDEQSINNQEENVDSFNDNGEKPQKKGRKQSQTKKTPKISNELLHKCPKPKCRKKFRDELRLQIHIRNHDGIDVRPIVCRFKYSNIH